MMPFLKIFSRKKSTKKLNLQEMWDLYRALRYGLQGKSQEYLADELLKILDGIGVEDFKRALRIMYGEIDYSLPPVELSLFFVKSIKTNNLLSFSDFVKVISGSSNK